MTADSPSHPLVDSWVAAVHASENDFEPLGAGVVIDMDRVLTCAHVVMTGGAVREELWVAFPKADNCPRRKVAKVTVEYSPPVRDLAVLILDEPVSGGVETAPIRSPKPGDLVNLRWWAFGFPNRDPVGNSADGQIGTALSYGWIRLDTNSRYLVEPGFSGGGLWSQDYEAIIGIVGQAHGNGDGRAITLHQANLSFPDHKLGVLSRWSAEAAGEVALKQWGWSLARDPEGIRHWQPRARGVGIESERGYRFRGRTVALTEIVRWLDRRVPDRQVLVVTGSPGVGKSAVLGRIVTTADADIRRSLPLRDEAIRATLGAVSCAVHAKAKTALEVAEEIARAASARLPEEPDDLAPAVREALGEGQGRQFNVIIDALDEAASPSQTRAIIQQVILPLVETCSDAGAQMIVGTRRRDDGGDILGRFGGALATIDLDDPQYFAEDDLAAYALACLQLAGDERIGNPYIDSALALPLAERIAAMSAQNFLIGGLIARSHGFYDEQAADPEQFTFTATIDSALDTYLRRLNPVAGIPARHALTALAFADAPGLPATLWQLAVKAIYGRRVNAESLIQFARSSAANFLVETASEISDDARGPGVAPVYRLFHQALNDALLRARVDITPRSDDERKLTRAFMRHGELSKWQRAPEYLLRSLPAHAYAAGAIDDLLGDNAYLLHADLRRLMQVADGATSADGQRRARLVRLTPRAIAAAPSERAALFSVTETLDNLGYAYPGRDFEAPYRARWAAVPPRRERAILEGHKDWVRSVCSVAVTGQVLLASAGDDQAVRIWDPQTGEQCAALEGHRGGVNGVSAVVGLPPLASAGNDGTVRIWHPQTEEQLAVLVGHQGEVYGICAVTVAGQAMLASAGNDGTVRIWNAQTGEQQAVMVGHFGVVRGVCAVTVAGQAMLASVGDDGTVRIWNAQTGEQQAVMVGHFGVVRGVCAVTVAGQAMLASVGDDRTVRIWNAQTGEQHAVMVGHFGVVRGVCAVTVAGQAMLASVGDDGLVRIWNVHTRKQHAILQGHQGWVRSVCQVTVAGQAVLASGGDDETVRIWDPEVDQQHAAQEGHQGWVSSLCAVTVAGQPMLASASDDETVGVWDPATGERHATLIGHQGWVRSVCAVTVSGQALLASAGDDRTVRIWDPQTGEQQVLLNGHQEEVYGVCTVTVSGQVMLASAGGDRTVRIWNPRSGKQRAVLEGHQSWVRSVCAVTVHGQALLASAGDDGTVRIWNPRSGQQRAVLEGHQSWVRSVCAVTVHGQALLASAGDDETVRIWDPQTGQQRALLVGHQGWVNSLCAVSLAGQALLASAGDDRTVRIWDLETSTCLLTVPTHHTALAVLEIAGSLAVGLDAGILMIKPNFAVWR